MAEGGRPPEAGTPDTPPGPDIIDETAIRTYRAGRPAHPEILPVGPPSYDAKNRERE